MNQRRMADKEFYNWFNENAKIKCKCGQNAIKEVSFGRHAIFLCADCYETFIKNCRMLGIRIEELEKK